MSRVFIVQEQLKWDEETGRHTPKFSFRSAAKYGELVVLLPPEASPSNPAPILAELRRKLADFRPDDYLLLVGSPALIGWATAIACLTLDERDPLQLLQWGSGKYSVIASPI